MLRRALLHLFLLAGTAAMIAPFLWMLLTSVKPEAEIFHSPPALLPSRWLWGNYAKAMEAAPFGRYFLNTAVYATASPLLNLFLCSLAAYAIARLQFRGKAVLFLAVLGTMMVPAQVTMIPTFIIIKRFPFAGGNDWLGLGGSGGLNTFWGLILPGAVGAFGIFLLRQFFLSLPRELEDAARIDGCSEFGIYWRIILPLSKPALATLAIFTFTAAWNDFLWPLIVMSREDLRVLQIGLMAFQSQHTTQWDLLMAGTVLVTLPVIAVFLVGQRYFTRGIALSGLKG